MSFFTSMLKTYSTFKATRFGKAFIRTQYRSLWLLSLTVAAGALIEVLVQSARFGGTDLAARFPEVIQILRALSILTWLEQGALWIRLAVSPKIDIQELANKLTGDSAPHASASGIAVVYLTNNIAWLVRMVILFKLCDF